MLTEVPKRKMPRNGRAPRPPVEPRALKPYRTYRIDRLLAITTQCVACIITISLTLLTVLFSTKARHIISKAFAHKSIYHYLNRYQDISQSPYPVASYGVPGSMWESSELGHALVEGEKSERSEEFQYNPEEKEEEERKVMKRERSLQDVVNGDDSVDEEKFGSKTIQEKQYLSQNQKMVENEEKHGEVSLISQQPATQSSSIAGATQQLNNLDPIQGNLLINGKDLPNAAVGQINVDNK